MLRVLLRRLVMRSEKRLMQGARRAHAYSRTHRAGGVERRSHTPHRPHVITVTTGLRHGLSAQDGLGDVASTANTLDTCQAGQRMRRGRDIFGAMFGAGVISEGQGGHIRNTLVATWRKHDLAGTRPSPSPTQTHYGAKALWVLLREFVRTGGHVSRCRRHVSR